MDTVRCLHFGQGKWYPGESLPRWALGCYWRKDGEPIWNNPELIAADNTDYRANAELAQTFIQHLAERLEVRGEDIVPGYEDTWYYLWKERRLPANVDPLKSNLEDKQERNRLARIFEQGLRHVVGYTLPMRPIYSDATTTRWESGRWLLRQENMFLLPGDSPMGFRLPLDSLPWYASDDTSSWAGARSAGAPRAVVRTPGFRVRRLLRQWTRSFLAEVVANDSRTVAGPCDVHRDRPQASRRRGVRPKRILHESPLAEVMIAAPTSQTIRTALCVEPRDGRMHVFMPPIARLEDYLRMIETIEATAEDLACPVMIEGYTPPWDYRLQHFKVTPDPGVIEVNLQPSSDWQDLVSNTTMLYDEARRSRLGTEKFMLDGRHTGTGGGNHIVLGGARPIDSPFLRRPDLLRSLVAYWNNRPSLSYLFSGLFVGPTSQAPRADEARHESLYELETAFSQVPEAAGVRSAGFSRNAEGELPGHHVPMVGGTTNAPPWLVDRLFRHLLTDLTGNTHRAEFCIDKLYSPDSASGRLGLVEFRSFEMPPHARMSLTQQLLVRALVARFWEVPYRQPLVRWGTSLHDRFMLPHFVVQDFLEVLGEMRDWGLPMEPDWFVPHFEFRFPLLGEATYDDVKMELRQAIEPWNVLGEEASSSGTARYVDSSVERLEVKVRNMTGRRHIITCNGRRVPLHPTGTRGEYVAGVRYRAWQPPSCLHPTIGVHTPLVFDLYDTWSGRSIGGCTWHVSHPGGRHYETFPVNAAEAESRRAARFQPIGHTPGPSPLPTAERNPDYPLTLDLRRPLSMRELAETI